MKKQPFALCALFVLAVMNFTLVLAACGEINTPTVLNATTITTTVNSIKPTINQASPKIPSYPPSVVRTLSPPTATVILAVSDWKYRWLQGIPCRAPCWEGITPGKTTMQEALDLLKQNPLVMGANISLTADNGEGSNAYIEWNWTKISAPSPGGNIEGSSVLTSSKVVRIAPGYRTPYKLGDVIKMYGEPSYIVADYRKLENNSYYAISITFSSQGIFLDYSSTNKPIINADLTFDEPARLIFFIPGEEAFPKIPFYDEYNKYRKPWSGYNTFDFYCRELPGSGNYCKYA